MHYTNRRILYFTLQMTNVTRQSSSPVNTDLVYYLVQSYDDNDDDNVSLTTADDTCQLMMSVSKQRAAIILGYVIVTLCQGVFTASLSVSLSVCLFFCPFLVCLSLCFCVCFLVCLFTCIVCLFVFCFCICLSLCFSI